MQETWVQSLGHEDHLELEMATRSSVPAWGIPWTEEPGGLPSQRVSQDESLSPRGLSFMLKSSILSHLSHHPLGFPGGSGCKGSPCNAGDWVWSLGWEDPVEKGMATHSSIFGKGISWTEEPDRGQKELGMTERLTLSSFYVACT